jgi:hypothetical protein
VARPVALSPDGDDLEVDDCPRSTTTRCDHNFAGNNCQATADDKSTDDCPADDDQHAAANQHSGADNIHYVDHKLNHDYIDDHIDVFDIDDDNDAQLIVRLSANLPSSQPS